MTNAEKYKTAKERAEAFYKYCETEHHTVSACCALNWLDLEAPAEEPLPCPFCGGKVQIIHDTNVIASGAKWLVNCYCCRYEYGAETKEKLIAEHNRVVKSLENEKVLQTHYLLGNLTAVCHILCPNNKGYEDRCECCYCHKLLSELCDLEGRIKRYRETMENSAANGKEVRND